MATSSAPLRDPSSLSTTERREYNRMAEHMDYFHNNFRHTWRKLESAVSPNAENPTKMSATSIINTANAFLSHLTAHHGIEEQYIFPVLAERMPAFRARWEHPPETTFAAESDQTLPQVPPEKETGEEEIAARLLEQHVQIHAGMDELQRYVDECRGGERDFRREEMWARMQGWQDVLWQHLKEEVAELGWQNMCKHWSLEEMRRMPM